MNAPLSTKQGQGFFRSQAGLQLSYRSWLPDSAPSATIVLIHGLAEHCGRYDHVARYFTQRGYAVLGFDLPGHGLSEGKRIYVDQFKEYVDDLALFYQQVQIAYPACPAFILAHSMGTTVALSFLIAHEPSLAGLILSGTAIKVGSDISPFMISLSGIVGAIFPKLPTIALNSNTISRDRHVVEAYHNDPLVFNGKIPARTGSELNRTFTYLQKKLSEITAPILILHGAADQLTDPAGSKLLFNNISSQDKTLELFEGLYHEILNEPEKEEILALIADWISDRVV